MIIIVMLAILCVFTTTYNTVNVSSYDNDKIIYNGNTQSNNVTLMINVYEGSEYVNDMIDIFKSYGVNTTFFIGGIWAEKNIETIAKIIANGHELGNHGYLHLDHNKLDYNQNYDEILMCHNIINVYTDYKMKLFAPPSGAFNNATIQATEDLGYLTIMWSKDTIDWRDHDTMLIYQRATNGIKGGDLILMHPTENTVLALPAILEFYKINNLNVTTVSQNLMIE